MLVELTLGNLGEHLVHRVPVKASHRELINIIHDPAAVVEEFPVQEDVSQPHLDEQVEKVEDLHCEEAHGVGVVLSPQLVVAE